MSINQVASAIVAFALPLAGCAKSPPAPSDPASGLSPADPPAARISAPPPEAPAAEQLPVAEAVAKLHRKGLERHEAEATIGRTLCLVTLSDPSLEGRHFFALALLARGAVSTWRQTSEGPKEVFQARLDPDEVKRANQLIDAIPRQAAGRVEPSATVIGVSTQVGEQVQTRYFDNEELPAPLSQLIAMLKQRLEETNRRRE